MTANKASAEATYVSEMERVNGLAPSSSFEMFLDERFPDTRLERIYPGMDFSGKSTAETEMAADE